MDFRRVDFRLQQHSSVSKQDLNVKRARGQGHEALHVSKVQPCSPGQADMHPLWLRRHPRRWRQGQG